jgi:hypothetical protein
MIKDSGKRLFDMIIVWKLDRFARNRYGGALSIGYLIDSDQHLLNNRRYIGGVYLPGHCGTRRNSRHCSSRPL